MVSINVHLIFLYVNKITFISVSGERWQCDRLTIVAEKSAPQMRICILLRDCLMVLFNSRFNRVSRPEYLENCKAGRGHTTRARFVL